MNSAMADADPKSDSQVPGALNEAPDADRPASATPTEQLLEEEIPGGARAIHDPYMALRHRGYVLFSIGWMISVIGSQVTAAAIAWEVYDRLSQQNATWAKFALGLVAGIQAVPLILLSMPAGALADRFNRARLIQIMAICAAACSIGLATLSYRPGMLPVMYCVLALLSAMQTLGRPARSALIPNLVPPEAFSNAITWNASVFQVASMTGPALAGLIIHLSLKHFGNLRVAYALDACCALAFSIMCSRLRITQPKRAAQPKQSRLQELAAGIHFVRNSKMILATITLDLFAVLLGGAVYLLPVFAKDILHIGPSGFGWLRGADAIGAFTMAIIIAHLPPMKKAGRNMLLAVMGFGAATIVFGLSRNFWLSWAMLFLIGAFDNISVVVRHTLVQVLTPDEMRGRVSAVNNIFIGASNELGGFESGITAAGFSILAMTMGLPADRANTFGPVASVVLGGFGTIITVLIIARVWPELRKLGSLG